MSRSGVCWVYAPSRHSALSGACLSGICIFEDVYATWKRHTFSRLRFRLLGFGFELVGLSNLSSRAHCSKLHCDRQDSIVIEIDDSGFW